jgi:pantothenate synthetase
MDYAALVRADSLEPAGRFDGALPLRLVIAARVGSVRLIDNLDPRCPLPEALAGYESAR